MSDIETAAIRVMHGGTAEGWCTECGGITRWPCETIRLCDALDAARAERDEAYGAGSEAFRRRAEKAEAEAADMRAAAIKLHGFQSEERARASKAEAALARVEALPERFDAIASDCSYGAPEEVVTAWLAGANQLRAALAGPSDATPTAADPLGKHGCDDYCDHPLPTAADGESEPGAPDDAGRHEYVPQPDNPEWCLVGYPMMCCGKPESDPVHLAGEDEITELREMWQSMIDGDVWPIREKRLACMAVGLVNQLAPLRAALMATQDAAGDAPAHVIFYRGDEPGVSFDLERGQVLGVDWEAGTWGVSTAPPGSAGSGDAVGGPPRPEPGAGAEPGVGAAEG